MTVWLYILTALAYGFVFRKLHERMVSAHCGARCDHDALGWWIRKPEPSGPIHPDQDCIECAEPPRNIWTVQRMPFGCEMMLVYERLRAPRLRS